MNDFTKKELLQILNCIGWFHEARPGMEKELEDKIQSMIDNYCNHEWRKGVHLFNDIYCTKCSKHFEVTNDDN